MTSPQPRPRPLRGELLREYDLLLGLDWMSRHVRLHELRIMKFRSYSALLDRLSPDQAKEGRSTSVRPQPGQTIALRDMPKVKKANLKKANLKKVD